MKKVKTLEVSRSEKNNMALLEFKVGPYMFCAPANDVKAIIQPPELTPVPLSSDLVAGCFVYQGRTATVLCMNTKLGISVSGQTDRVESHVILAEVDNGLKGFWVDVAKNIDRIESLVPVPDYYSHDLKAYEGFLLRDREILLQTTFERLFRCARSRMHWSSNLPVTCNTCQPDAQAGRAACNDINRQDMPTPVSANDTYIDNRGHAAVDTTLAATGNTGTPANNDSDFARKVANADYTVSAETAASCGGHTEPQQHGPIKTHNRLSNTGISHAAGKTALKGFSAMATAGRSPYAASRNSTGDRPGAIPEHCKPGQRLAGTGLRRTSLPTQQPARPLLNRGNAAIQQHNPGYCQQNDLDTYGDRNNPAARNKIGLLPPIAALLAVVALGVGSTYMLNGKSRSVAGSNPVISGHVTVAAPHTRAATSGGGNTVTDESSNPMENEETGPDYEATATGQANDAADPLVSASMQASTDSLDTTVTGRDGQLTGRIIEFNLTETRPETGAPEKSQERINTYNQYSVAGSKVFVHVVKEGDTLWHITRLYLGNPFRYPELAESSHIQNPHLIYPGDTIRFSIRQAD